MAQKTKLERFENEVISRFNLYNSVFSTLPYSHISKTSTLLPFFAEFCALGFDQNKNPIEIVEEFFEQYYPNNSEKDNIDTLFRLIQFIERQVVLFDAIEDAAFTEINNFSGRGTLRSSKEEAAEKSKTGALKDYLSNFRVRPVLTAHPTQFYPGSVLGIITDLSTAIKVNDLPSIKILLAQLGRTPFFKKEKPTPLDEAKSLMWYLEHVFYHSVSNIHQYIKNNIFDKEDFVNPLINLGFWPGGDRDGNPFVTTDITLKTAQGLRSNVIRNYYRDIRKLRRRLTFKGVENIAADIETKLYNSIFSKKEQPEIPLADLTDKLEQIHELLVSDYHGMFAKEVDALLNKVNTFGYHFASLDIRQDSRVHHEAFMTLLKGAQKQGVVNKDVDYLQLDEAEKIEFLTTLKGDLSPDSFSDELVNKTLGSIRAMQEIQTKNGQLGCHRYIISNNQTAQNIFEVFAMIRLSNWEVPTVDVAPLFETITDLSIAPKVMDIVYSNPTYRNHLRTRGDKQTIMLGFSDGTKDGGYLMANWSIFRAKEELTEVSRKHGIKALFFDGRGGPPARGGGNTHQFYASLGDSIESDEIQITVQGQTISSNFGTVNSCQYNLEQLLSSGIANRVFNSSSSELSVEDRQTMDELAETSYQAYQDFKSHPKFLPYLEHMSTLKFYAKTNIGSRPTKRGKSKSLDFSALRAIPFVGSWSQLKQNVPGFYGVGLALEKFEESGRFDQVLDLYQSNAFFRTLVYNSMMSLTKSFFKLTAYMQNDPEYGAFWDQIYAEYQRSKKYLLKLTGQSELMENEPAGKASIMMREKIVLPLLTIQQYALGKLHQKGSDEILEKMVTRSLFGNINASRNSA
ncbi:MAG: phosphoenolpyruvate carboxylase [Flavobacteriaceae bacterium]|nr:phosphoenolpyruvate carboxylase [Flavobacteriaceae bacterium]